MKYEHILSYVARTVWAILPEKMDEILSVLAFRAAGQVFTPAEIHARIGDPAPTGAATPRGVLAILPLRGVIAHRMGTMQESSGGMSAERFAAMVRTAAANDDVGTILIDVDSPGGTVPGVMEAADAVFEARARKHVVAIANSTMASAAYWIASQAHELVAIPSALDGVIGSIGAFIVHQDLSIALQQAGIKMTLVRAGKHKAGTNPFEPLSEEAQADLQARVDNCYAQFVKAVARGRGISVAAVRSGYGEGKALPAAEAKAAGLIDRIATFDATVALLMRGRLSPAGLRGPMAAGPRTDADAAAAEEDLRQRLEWF